MRIEWTVERELLARHWADRSIEPHDELTADDCEVLARYWCELRQEVYQAEVLDGAGGTVESRMLCQAKDRLRAITDAAGNAVVERAEEHARARAAERLGPELWEAYAARDCVRCQQIMGSPVLAARAVQEALGSLSRFHECRGQLRWFGRCRPNATAMTWPPRRPSASWSLCSRTCPSRTAGSAANGSTPPASPPAAAQRASARIVASHGGSTGIAAAADAFWPMAAATREVRIRCQEFEEWAPCVEIPADATEEQLQRLARRLAMHCGPKDLWMSPLVGKPPVLAAEAVEEVGQQDLRFWLGTRGRWHLMEDSGDRTPGSGRDAIGYPLGQAPSDVASQGGGRPGM